MYLRSDGESKIWWTNMWKIAQLCCGAYSDAAGGGCCCSELRTDCRRLAATCVYGRTDGETQWMIKATSAASRWCMLWSGAVRRRRLERYRAPASGWRRLVAMGRAWRRVYGEVFRSPCQTALVSYVTSARPRHCHSRRPRVTVGAVAESKRNSQLRRFNNTASFERNLET